MGILSRRIPTFRPYGTLRRSAAIVFYPHHAPSGAYRLRKQNLTALPHNWGDRLIERLAKDLKEEFPDLNDLKL
jgi:hypothetical protein